MVSYKIVLLTALTSLVIAEPPDITFLCDEMPEICTSMCWAIRCASPPFSQYLTLDFPSQDVQRQRSISAGCGPNNMCITNSSSNLVGSNKTGHRGPPYNACNVYPFSSTRESTFPNGHQVSRCVPEAEQCRQRSELELLSRKYHNASLVRGGIHRISINFGNPGNIKYCNNDPCINDGFEVQDETIKKRSQEPKFNYYKTNSGMVLASIDQHETPSNFTRRVGSNEVVPLDVEAWFERTSTGRLHMMADTIVGQVSAQSLKV